MVDDTEQVRQALLTVWQQSGIQTAYDKDGDDMSVEYLADETAEPLVKELLRRGVLGMKTI